ncbi:FKBP-type peptidyl-prolyl cis-trans isomerase [Mucilaginibacter sp. UR6-11]|uniref:FKBP-type peptidyl-prolyl cis-trans isomerase n=1 Tax=Mucilaginibacter sp. UR6-11 TaxID=1435644 RepID=UPI001E349272|nr:FKBP-type peptidyl-prolyl cis-trans isomerase [Mucilaginibacter sp. UR6-11]MCC8424470.1 FKBP-type peptidyl-prolyl cis-trans isomerase [Mucilaginibacter sp. UR6-11]
MKKYLLLICVFAIAFSSCRKTVESPFDPTEQAKLDDKAIQDYFLSNGITNAIKDPSGLYYTINNAGTGAHPTTSSNITVNYTGFLLDGTQFDSQSSYFFHLTDLIEAWKIGLPLIGKGGTITMYVPSGLAYGSAGSSKVPSNTCLIFTITLQGFTN